MVNLGAERYRSHYDRSKSKDKWDETYPGITLTKMAVEPLADAIRGWKNEALAAGRGRRSRAAKRNRVHGPPRRGLRRHQDHPCRGSTGPTRSTTQPSEWDRP